MALLGGDSNFVGIDIGSSGIRLVQLKHGGGKPLLVTYGEMPAALEVTQSDASLDQDKVAGMIKELAGQLGISSNQAIAGLPSTKVYASVVAVPKMTDAELAKGIKYQAERAIPIPLDQVNLSWAAIPSAEGAKEMEVLIVATPKQGAEKIVELCRKAGFELVGLEPSALAMSRALVPAGQASTVAVIDIGGIATDLTVLSAGVPKLIRAIPVGGLTFAKTVAQHLGIQLNQAQQFIQKFGLTRDKLEGQVFDGIKPAVDSLVSEITKSVEFFQTNHQGVRPERLVMTGEGSSVPELPAYIATAVNLPVEIGNPWVNIAYPTNLTDQLTGQASRYAVAAGLAMKVVG